MLGLNECCYFGNGYCNGEVMNDGSSYRVHISCKDGCSVDVESVGVDVEELTRYLVDTASEPRREVKKYDSEERLNRIMEEMSNAPLYDLGFIALDADDTSVKSVAEGGGFTYTVLFDGRSSLYTYRVEDKKRDESISVMFTSVLPFSFSNLIEALGLADE